LAAGAARIGGSLILRLWLRAARRPVDSFAIVAAIAASLTIVINAVVMQPGPRPAPFFVNDPPAPLSSAPQPRTRSADERPSTETVTASRNDPIAQLIAMSSHIMTVQRALSDYGYGQIQPTGVLDQPTRAAIEKFEREHGLPVTGRISAGLESDLAAMVGHPLD
jgi:hypothetical protein